MRIIFKKTAAVLIIALMFFSDFPVGIFEDATNAIRDRNVVDLLWQAERNGSVVDSFRPDIARAAEAAIDTTVNTTILSHQKSAKNTVCISDTVCYAFYVDSDVDVVYQKSTDGGASWGGTGTDIHAGSWIALAVWYDRWTPGDTTGTLVHMVYFSTADDLTYAVFNTSGDTFTANVVIAATGAQGSLTSANDVVVSKGTDGDLYAATVDATAPTSPAIFTHKCAGTCTTASNWVSAGSNPWDGVGDDTDNNHSIVLLPLPDDATHDAGDMMLVSLDIGDGTVEYKVYDDSANSWSTDFTNLPVGATDSTTYTHTLSGAVDIVSGDLYVAYIHNAGTANTSEVRAAKYTGGAWSSLTDPWPDTTDSTSIVTDASIGIDSNSGDLYVVYSRGASATANDVYYSKSINDGSTWSIDNLLSSGTDRNHRAISINSSSADRLFSIYHDLTATTGNDLYGNTVADLWVWNQEAYRWFANADSVDAGSALATQDNAATLTSSGEAFRLRLLLHNTGQTPISGENLKLQFAEQSGTCDTGFSGESYADVTAATVIAYNNNATPADGDNINNITGDPSAGHTVVNQDYEELNNFTNTATAVPSGQDGKWDFSLIDNGATANTSYCFRAVESDGTQLDTYTVVPEVITAAGSPVYSVSITSSGVIEYGFVDIGNATSTVSHGYTQTAQNDGDTSEKLNVKSSDATVGTGWTLASTIGTNQFKHEFSTTTGSVWTVMPDSATYVTAKPSVAVSGTVSFDFRLTTPSASTDYQQKSITITVQAVAP